MHLTIEASKIKDSLIRPTFSIDQMFHFARLVQMFEIINRICPESLHDKVPERSTISKYGTRNKTELQIPWLNIDLSRERVNYTGLKTCNSILKHIRESNTKTLFKNGLRMGKNISARNHRRTVLVFLSFYSNNNCIN